MAEEQIRKIEKNKAKAIRRVARAAAREDVEARIVQIDKKIQDEEQERYRPIEIDLTMIPDELLSDPIAKIDLTTPIQETDSIWKDLASKGQILVELINTTAAWKHRACLIERAATVTMLTEHSILRTKLTRFLNYVRKEGTKHYAPPRFVEGMHWGASDLSPHKLGERYRSRPSRTHSRKQVRSRVGMFAVNLTKGKVLTYVVLYGHTGGRKDQKQAAATNALLIIAHEELDAQPKGPKLLAGDLNADPSNLPFLQTMCQTDGWTDVGEKSHMWGGLSCEHTCLGHNAKQPTRNGFLLY